MTIKVPHRPRTQSDRRAQTRKALFDATFEVLLDNGYDGCSLANVAKRAGLTTGAVQHHFKTKAQLMLAVVEEQIFNINDAKAFDTTEGATLTARCRHLVDEQWRYYGNPKYLTIWTIILGGRSNPELMSKITGWQQEAILRHEVVIKKLFAEHNLKPKQIRAIQYFVNAQLRGLSLLQTVDTDPRIIDAQLKMLVNLLEAHVTAA